MIRSVIDLLLEVPNYSQSSTSSTSIYVGNELVKTDPILITAPRRFGKTTNLIMLRDFFGGFEPKETFLHLKIGDDDGAMKMWNSFEVVYITFGHCYGRIETYEDGINACRSILHRSFCNFKYISSTLPKKDIKAFEDWVNEKTYTCKTKYEVGKGLQFLLQCIREYSAKPILLLIDEFDRICSKAIFNVNADTLNKIMSFYCDMVGDAIKHESNCIALLTGVAAITFRGLASSLNNIRYIKFLENQVFAEYYGITRQEFDGLLKRDEMPVEVREQKEIALTLYNGYKCFNLQILNTYSIAKFIESKIIGEYWRHSGCIEGLEKRLKEKPIRDKIQKLLNNEPLDDVNIKATLKPTNFCLVKNDAYVVDNVDTLMNFLIQQGYLTTCRIEQKILVEIPNQEVRAEFIELMTEYFQRLQKFDPSKIRACCDYLLSMDMRCKQDCQTNLVKVKKTLNTLLCDKKVSDLNEAWLESFLFHVFIETFEIKQQEKVLETTRHNDLRTAKKLDLFLQFNDRCFVFEETINPKNKQDSLSKLLGRKYYINAQNTGLDYLLIGIDVCENDKGFVNIDMRYLHNTHLGEGEDVK